MKITTATFLILALALPGAAEAQRRGSYNPFSFTPYVGAYRDAYDLQADDSNLGWMIGFRAGYHESRRLTLHANLGYAETNDVGTRAPLSDAIYDNQWVLLTGGADFALVPGNTSIAVGADAGVAWRNNDGSGSDIDPAPASGWAAYEIVVPSLIVRHGLSTGTSLSLSLQDYIFDVFEGTVEHSPALTLGLTFR